MPPERIVRNLFVEIIGSGNSGSIDYMDFVDALHSMCDLLCDVSWPCEWLTVVLGVQTLATSCAAPLHPRHDMCWCTTRASPHLKARWLPR